MITCESNRALLSYEARVLVMLSCMHLERLLILQFQDRTSQLFSLCSTELTSLGVSEGFSSPMKHGTDTSAGTVTAVQSLSLCSTSSPGVLLQIFVEEWPESWGDKVGLGCGAAYPSRNAAGFQALGCRVYNTRGRAILAKASRALIADNTFTHLKGTLALACI